MPVRSEVVSTALAKVPQLTMLPAVAVRVMQVAGDPDASVRDMVDVIVHSPALTTRVLRVVNSPIYGLPGQVGSIDRAVGLLGLASVKNVAIAATLTRTFEGRPLSPTFSPKDLWLHSLGVAATAQMIARGMTSDVGEEAYLAGLIHDVGVMIELQIDREKLGRILRALEADDSVNLIEVEEQSFSANHQDFGRGLSEHWKLPRSFAVSTGAHHAPLGAAPDHRTLASVVHIADRLVLLCQPGFKLDLLKTGISDDVLDHLRLSRGELEAIAERVPALVAEAKAYVAG